MPRDDGYARFTLVDPEFFESLDRYQPSGELLAIVRDHLEPDWIIDVRGFWTRCIPPRTTARRQGWKIHIAAVEFTAEDILRRVLPVLVSERVAFKYCSDRRMIRLATSKNWPRASAGKFITIYPQNDEQFIRLLERTHDATRGCVGPYVLSDRAYKNSRVVYYRYGDHRHGGRLNGAGERVATLISPDGREVIHERVPFFHLPPWVTDPVGGDVEQQPADILLRDRYRVTAALRYSTHGGVYEALDTKANQSVLIREARPMLSMHQPGIDCQRLLEKEARILQRLAHTSYVPQYIDLFREWEHVFLVQERLVAQTLWNYAISSWGRAFSPATLPTPRALVDAIAATLESLVRGLDAIHREGVILRDLTKTNVLVTEQGHVKFVDFELAYEVDGTDPPTPGWTHGYASPNQLANGTPTVEDDYYALGALILDVLSFNASALNLNREGALSSLDLVLCDMGLPAEFRELAVGLLNPDQEKRWRLSNVLDTLQTLRSGSVPVPDRCTIAAVGLNRTRTRTEIAATVEGITSYISSIATPTRSDRLWPGSPELFVTNPVSLQCGAAGIAEYLRRATRSVPSVVVDWIDKALRRYPCPPTLYSGGAGVALHLLNIGLKEKAAALLPAGGFDEHVYDEPGLYYGRAGWGIANLHFWIATGEDKHLRESLHCAEQLMRTAHRTQEGTYWRHGAKIPFGLGHGQSGIALFLIYAHAATGEAQLLALAREALAFELKHSERRHGLLLWRQHEGLAAGPLLPYTRYGTAGFASAALRYHAVTNDNEYRAVLDSCVDVVTTRCSEKPWQDFGLAGCGEFLIDMYQFTGSEEYLERAWHLATGILPYRLHRVSGIAFAGRDHLRISCDIGMGSAGIGLFLHRLLNPDTPRLLFCDDILRSERAASTVLASAGAVARVDNEG